VAHKLSRNVGGVSGTEILPPRPEGPPCACLIGQHVYKQSRGSVFSSIIQACSPDPPMDPGEATFIEGNLYPRVSKSGGRALVEEF